MNEALKEAIARAALSEQELAARCEVDLKTVERWIAQDGRIPHPRHRRTVASALGVEAEMLWPDTIRRNVKTGPDREIVSVYPRRSDCPKSVWQSLITGATQDITLAGYTSYFLWLDLPNLRSALARKAESGCTVRFLLGDPDSEVTRRREVLEAVPLTITTRINVTLDELAKTGPVPGIEARFTDEHLSMSLWRFDDNMIIATHLHHAVGHDSPHLHIQRCQDGGIFDRYAWHLSELWKSARPVTDLSDRRPAE